MLLVVLGLLISYIGPLLDLGRTFHLSRQSSTELQQTRAENEKLQKQAEFLQSEAALKREARRQGMVAEGERAYVISGLRR